VPVSSNVNTNIKVTVSTFQDLQTGSEPSKTSEKLNPETLHSPTLRLALADMILARTTLLVASCSALSIGLAVAAPLARTHDRRDAVSVEKRDSVRITSGDGTEDTPWTKRDDSDSVRITGVDSTNDTPWGVKRDNTDSVRITGGGGTDDTPRTKRDDSDSVRITGGDSTNDTPWTDRVKRGNTD
jgi:hypothetical protein